MNDATEDRASRGRLLSTPHFAAESQYCSAFSVQSLVSSFPTSADRAGIVAVFDTQCVGGSGSVGSVDLNNTEPRSAGIAPSQCCSKVAAKRSTSPDAAYTASST